MRREFFRVTDHFAVLGITRAAWTDADVLKEKFLRRSAQQHPDAAGGSAEDFATLNAAWQTLREPAGCLRHFLELAHPEALAATPSAHAPVELADLFMDIAAARQLAQKFRAKLASASSPLTRAMLEPERVGLRARIATLALEIETRTAQIASAVRAGTATPRVLAEALASLGFFGKWSALLAELQFEFQHTPA